MKQMRFYGKYFQTFDNRKQRITYMVIIAYKTSKKAIDCKFKRCLLFNLLGI